MKTPATTEGLERKETEGLERKASSARPDAPDTFASLRLTFTPSDLSLGGVVKQTPASPLHTGFLKLLRWALPRALDKFPKLRAWDGTAVLTVRLGEAQKDDGFLRPLADGFMPSAIVNTAKQAFTKPDRSTGLKYRRGYVDGLDCSVSVRMLFGPADLRAKAQGETIPLVMTPEPQRQLAPPGMTPARDSDALAVSAFTSTTEVWPSVGPAPWAGLVAPDFSRESDAPALGAQPQPATPAPPAGSGGAGAAVGLAPEPPAQPAPGTVGAASALSGISATISGIRTGEPFEAVRAKVVCVRRELQDQVLVPLLEPAFNERLKQLPSTTLEEKRAICQWVTTALEGTDLAVAVPDGDSPALLVASVGGKAGRFEFIVTDPVGSERRVRLRNLPEYVRLTSRAGRKTRRRSSL